MLCLLLLFFALAFNSSLALCQKPIDASREITIGGIRQYIRIKGKDESKPIILFLHGGPGGSLMQQNDKITGSLQNHFVVVQWDQRETGQTFQLNKSPQPLTLDLFYTDTHDLVDSLLKIFQRPKLYLLGYSWGTVLGFYMADKYPDLLYAYIAVSPVIDQWRSDSISLAMLKNTMGNKARKELSQVNIPFENIDQLYFHRKWLIKFEEQKFVGLFFTKNRVRAWGATWLDIWRKASYINLFKSLPQVRCPVYFFAGENDYHTNYTMAKDYFNYLTAPKKDFFLFSETGHALPEIQPDLFQDKINSKVLPATFPQADAENSR